MKANHFFEESVKQHKEAAYELYQRMVDEVFGEGAVKIDYVDTDNNVLCCFKYEDCFACFKENLKNRLKCLKFTAKKNDAYQELLHLVKQVADPEEGELAYAKLVVWHELSLSMEGQGLRLDDLAVGILGDIIGGKMGKMTERATLMSRQTAKCKVIPYYPWDANEADYEGERMDMLEDELTNYLIQNNKRTEGEDSFFSKVNPEVSYDIYWGNQPEVIDCWREEYSPYWLAKMTKDLVLKRYADSIVNKGKNVVVLVNVPWNCSWHRHFEDAEYTYFRTLARRTFFGHQCDYMPMCELTPTYYGYESVNEVAEQLTGLVVIDDSGNDSETLCYSFSNPNREREDKIVMTFLELVKLLGANENVYEDFEMDNY